MFNKQKQIHNTDRKFQMIKIIKDWEESLTRKKEMWCSLKETKKQNPFINMKEVFYIFLPSNIVKITVHILTNKNDLNIKFQQKWAMVIID